MKIKHFLSFLLLLKLQLSFFNCNASVFENKEAVVNNIEVSRIGKPVSGFEKSGFTENNIFEASFLKAVSCQSVSFSNGYAELVESWKVLEDAGVDQALKRDPDFIKRFHDAEIPDASLKHADDGDFTFDPKTNLPSRMKGGGHGQRNIELLEEYGFEYNIVKTYDNGVRIGNVPLHKSPAKRTGTEQSEKNSGCIKRYILFHSFNKIQ